jgi:hypothetical protein
MNRSSACNSGGSGWTGNVARSGGGAVRHDGTEEWKHTCSSRELRVMADMEKWA